MTTPKDSPTPAPAQDASAAELEADIERTREQLGQTVDALSVRLDLKTQAKHKADEVKTRATEQVGHARARGGQLVAQARGAATDERGRLKPVVPAGAAGVAAVIVAIMLWRRRR